MSDDIRENLTDLVRSIITVTHKKVAYDINCSNDVYGPGMEKLDKDIKDLDSHIQKIIDEFANYMEGLAK